MYAIVSNNTVVFGPQNWDASVFSTELLKNGVNVTLPVAEPGQKMELNGASILTVITDKPEVSDTEVLIYAGLSIVGDNVVESYTKRDKTSEELKEMVPKAVTPRQLRMALTQLNLRSAVESVIANGTQDDKDAWEYSLEVQRTHPLVIAMTSALNKTEEEVDNLFILASTL
jgi:hypothetical protein